MDVKLALGAELDIASSAELNSVRDDIGTMFDKNRRVKPMYFSQTGAIVVSGTFTGICYVGSPATGRVWNILGYSVLGETDDAASSAGVASLYVGDRPATGQPTLSQVKAAGLTLPSSNTFGENVIWCPSAQDVFFKLAGITGVTQFIGNVFIAEYREDDVFERSGR